MPGRRMPCLIFLMCLFGPWYGRLGGFRPLLEDGAMKAVWMLVLGAALLLGTSAQAGTTPDLLSEVTAGTTIADGLASRAPTICEP